MGIPKVSKCQFLTAVKITLKMEAIRSYETVETAYKITGYQRSDHTSRPEVLFTQESVYRVDVT